MNEGTKTQPESLAPSPGGMGALKEELITLLPDLRAFSRFLCRERAAADDLLQNTIATALAKQHQFEAGTNLKAWLFTIMRTQFYSDLRSMRRRRDALDSACSDNVVPSPEHRAELMDLTAALWRLNPQYREALILVGAGGFSYEEAAELCGCAVGTMKARVSRARRQLAEAMA
ncbi:sigma-70 family RNA polymerase sigma factor [Vineibacter terrae]|nr:sigma-70 family RNA polymerase sigma factor [Vineibacter terrae]HEX2891667.1 sigma-70 family RNA polymerase sigma factor [Vineibacter terrae]